MQHSVHVDMVLQQPLMNQLLHVSLSSLSDDQQSYFRS